ncbi:FGGY-family carbohydrate kinase [Thalassospira lucentensis]|uniref:FGGY-family carbohydrate kinase n=1 Tax=Thalassospira lucentensis TaxID=168935 RepID=UPI003AA88EDB
MTDTRAIAVIDIGKTNAKLVVWDAKTSAILFEASRANHSIDGPPYCHLDVDGLWDFYISALKDAAREALIGRIVVTTHGATVAVLKGNKLALPVVDYENTYSSAINRAYDAVRDAFADSQNPNLPAGLNFGRQIFALEETFTEEMAPATDFLPYPQYWAWKLSGVKACEVTSLGCHSDLWHPHERTWSHLAKTRGWDQKFPPMRKAQDILGMILPDIAQQTGLPTDCNIHCGIHDSNATLVPLIRQLEPPFTLVSSGTWTICFSVGLNSQPALLEDRDTLCNVDLNGNAVPSARFMGGREYAQLANGHHGIPEISAINRLIDQGCFALPSFAEAGGPFVGNPGRIIREDALTSPEDKAALATLYCALMTDYCLETIESAGPIIIEGPFAANDVLCQLLAAIRSQQTVLTTPDSSGTSFGAAMLSNGPFAEYQRQLDPVPIISVPGLQSYHHKWRELI